MRVQVRYPDGRAHIVELPEPLAHLGRDPSADLVLYDTACSRRHAVLEKTPQGVYVRDAGSIHGTHVGGKRVERRLLSPGEEVRMGTVSLRLLADFDGTPAERAPVRPEDLQQLGPPTDRAHAQPPVLAAKALGLAWAAFTAIFAAIGIAFFATFNNSTVRWTALIAGLLTALWSLAMAWGWIRLAAWVKPAQLLSSGIGLVLCPFTMTALVTGAYAMRFSALAPSGTGVPSTEVLSRVRSDRVWALIIAISLSLSALLLTLGTVYVLTRAEGVTWAVAVPPSSIPDEPRYPAPLGEPIPAAPPTVDSVFYGSSPPNL